MQRAILFVAGVLFTVATVANAQACQAPVQLSTALSILSVVKDLSTKVSKLQVRHNIARPARIISIRMPHSRTRIPNDESFVMDVELAQPMCL